MGTPTPIRSEDLRRLGAAETSACNTLYSADAVTCGELQWQWGQVETSVFQHSVTMDVAVEATLSHPLLLQLSTDVIGLPASPFDWRDLQGPARAAGWASAHEPLLRLIETVLARQCTLRSVAPPTSETQCSDPAVCVGFEVRSRSGVFVIEGAALLPSALAEQVAARSLRFERVRDAIACDMIMRSVVDSISVAASECASLSCGALIWLDNGTLATPHPQVTLRLGKYCWRADIDEAQVTIRDRLPHRLSGTHHHEELPMPPEISAVTNMAATDSAESEDGTSAVIDPATLPIELTFELGGIAVPLGELERIRPGYVFSLEKPLDAQVISVFANGTHIGCGELVSVDNRVAVRLHRETPAMRFARL